MLFVCSVGMLRSPTAQVAASTLGFNARACGSDVSCALIPLSCNLINWAEKIFFMNVENFQQALDEFTAVGYEEDIRKKAVVWNIEDDFEWGDNWLFHHFLEKLEEFK